LDLEVLGEGKFIRFVKKGEWEYTERINCSGIVIIMATTADDRIILIEQHRPPLGRKVIEYPAGLVDDHHHIENESEESAAKRELLEETGYKTEKVEKILVGPVACGSSADLISFYRAENVIKVDEGGGDETEDIIVHAIPFIEIEEWLAKMEENGCLIEPKIYTGLYFLHKYSIRKINP